MECAGPGALAPARPASDLMAGWRVAMRACELCWCGEQGESTGRAIVAPGWGTQRSPPRTHCTRHTLQRASAGVGKGAGHAITGPRWRCRPLRACWSCCYLETTAQRCVELEIGDQAPGLGDGIAHSSLRCPVGAGAHVSGGARVHQPAGREAGRGAGLCWEYGGAGSGGARACGQASEHRPPTPHAPRTHPTQPHPQVLLTLYANAAEQFAAVGEEEEEEEAALDAELAGGEALAALVARGLAEDEGAATLGALGGELAGVARALRDARAAAAGLALQAELQSRLADFDAAVGGGAFTEAAWIAVELQKAAAGSAAPGGDAATADALDARVGPLRARLLAALSPPSAYWGVDERTHAPVLRPSGAEGGTDASAEALGEVWRAVGVLGGLPQALDTLAAALMHACVAPLLAAPPAGSAGGVPSLSDSPGEPRRGGGGTRATRWSVGCTGCSRGRWSR